jgi:glycosyltransferase involved in cell wall biosynthesis
VTLVTIGMPIFNEEAFLSETLDALLAQELGDFELCISDNASTDRTEEIARSYEKRDRRIRYHRQPRNLGTIDNFNGVARAATGKYFMWAGGHDLWHPQFLSKCVRVLEADAEVGLAYPRTRWIGPDGETVRDVSDGLGTDGLGTVARFNTVIWRMVKCTAIYGVIRRELLHRTPIFRRVFGADMVLLAELACYSKFIELPEPLFMRRQNRPAEGEAQPARIVRDMHGDAKPPRWSAPYAGLAVEYPRMVLRADVSPATKAIMLASLGLCVPSRYGGRVLDELRALVKR